MTIPELLKEIYDSSRERIKTPITGAYTLAFILWNWRPILLLIFEKVNVSDKIIIINNEYCNWQAIFGPLGIALIFTIVVPFLMTAIDWSTESPKKTRLKNVYKNKIYDAEYQIDLAKQELVLQDIRSGNKEKQDFIDKIKQLEQQIIDLNESNKVVVENYKKQLDDLKTSVPKTPSVNNIVKEILENRKLERNFEEILHTENLVQIDIERFIRFPNDIITPIPFVNIGMKIINVFRNYNFLHTGHDKKDYLTKEGLEFVTWVKAKNISNE